MLAFPKGISESNLEEVCLALTMARMLQAEKNVTVFVRNDGVYLVDAGVLAYVSAEQGDPDSGMAKCVIPMPDGTMTFLALEEHLSLFLAESDPAGAANYHNSDDCCQNLHSTDH